MKAHSPILILALWLTALLLSSLILYSCEKAHILPADGDCPNHQQDTTTNQVDTTAQN